MATELVCSFEGVSFRYAGSEEDALKNVSFSLRRGGWLAVLGANGSGKSTLAKHINALLRPTRGKCLVLGLDTSCGEAVWRIRSGVGMVFQNPDNQIVSSVVEEDVAFGPENLGVDPGEIRRRVDEALEVVGLKGKRSFPTYMLSGGEKQRLAIAGALAMEPQILVLDEPTAMLDPEGREEILVFLSRLRSGRDISIVYVTHRLEEALFADEALVLSRGEAVFWGSMEELFSADWETLRRWGVDVPDQVRILRSLGLPFSRELMDPRSMASFLWESRSYADRAQGG